MSYAEMIAAGRRLLGLGQAQAAINALMKASDLRPAAAEPYAVMAAVYSAGRRWNLALAALDAAIERSDDRGPLYAQRAAIHERLGNRAAAEADCTDALALLPGDPQIALRRAGLRWRSDWAGCQADLDTVLRAEPDNFEALVSRGRIYALKGSYLPAAIDLAAALRFSPRADGVRALFRQVLESGLARCSAAIVMNPADPRPYAERAAFRRIASDLRVALCDLDRAVDLAPANLPLRLQRAELLCELGRLSDAQADLSHILTADEGQAAAWFCQAAVQERQAAPEQAIDSLRRGLALAPDSAQAWLRLGRLLRQQRQLDEALGALDRSIALQPCCVGARDDRAAILADLGRHEAALGDLLRAAQLRPSPERWHRCGLNRTRCGQVDEALPFFNAALTLEPEYAPARCERGLALMHLGDTAGAARDYAAALAADPACYLALTGQATLALRRGAHAEAIEHASRAIRLRPELALAFHIRGWARIGANEHALASVDLQRAIQLAPTAPLRGPSQAILAQIAPARPRVGLQLAVAA